MAANLPPEKRIENKRRAWEMACNFRTQAAIGRELGVNQGTVSRYLTAARASSAEALAEEVTTYFILSIRQSDEMLFEAMEAFHRSKKPKKKATKRVDGSTTAATPADPENPASGPAPAKSTTTTDVSDRDGDPAWLKIGMDVLRSRAELLDRFAAKATAAAGGSGGGGTVADWLLEAEAELDAREPEQHQLPPPPIPPEPDPA